MGLAVRLGWLQGVLIKPLVSLVMLAMALSACSVNQTKPRDAAAKISSESPSNVDVTALGMRYGMSDDMYYHLLVAELAGQYDDFENAGEAYGKVLEIAGESDLAAEEQYLLARRAWEMGRYSENTQLAERAAQAWQQQDESFTPRLARVVAVESADNETQQKVLAEVLDLPQPQRAGFAELFAKQYTGTAQSEEALRMVDLWLEAHPNDVDMLRSGAVIAEGSNAAAVAYQWWYRHAELVEDPDAKFQSQAHSAANLRLLGAPEEAARVLSDLHKQKPDDHWVSLEYGRALLQSDKPLESAAVLETLAGVLNTNPEVLYIAGFANYAGERYEKAASYFEAALAKGYSEHDSRYWIGLAKLRAKHEKTAIEWLGTLGQGKFWRRAQYLIGGALARLGEWQEFDSHYAALRRAEPDKLAQWYLAEGRSLVDVELYERAAIALDKAVEADPNDLEIRYQRGVLCAELKRYLIAEDDLKRVIAGEPDNAQAMNALGYMLIDGLGDVQQGVPLVKRALALAPESAPIMDSYGWGLLLQGDLDEALHWLEKAWHRHKDHEIGAHLGEALWLKKRTKKARSVWAAALQMSQGKRENKVLQAYERLGIDAD